MLSTLAKLSMLLAAVSQLLTQVSGLLLEPRNPKFEAATETGHILSRSIRWAHPLVPEVGRVSEGSPDPQGRFGEIRETRERGAVMCQAWDLQACQAFLPPGRLGELSDKYLSPSQNILTDP